MTMKTFYRHLISAGITFIATFFLVVGFAISQDTFVFSKDALMAVIASAMAAAARALGKIIYELCYTLLSAKK
jgi:hypothetical protein